MHANDDLTRFMHVPALHRRCWPLVTTSGDVGRDSVTSDITLIA